MMQLSGTTLTKRYGPLGHLNNAYVGLALLPECSDGSKTVTLKRYGDYEVRLIDFSQDRSTADCLFWLELYCRMTRSSPDSCRCDDLDDAYRAVKFEVLLRLRRTLGQQALRRGLSASLAWGLAGPTFECVSERADFLVAEQPRDF